MPSAATIIYFIINNMKHSSSETAMHHEITPVQLSEWYCRLAQLRMFMPAWLNIIDLPLTFKHSPRVWNVEIWGAPSQFRDGIHLPVLWSKAGRTFSFFQRHQGTGTGRSTYSQTKVWTSWDTKFMMRRVFYTLKLDLGFRFGLRSHR